MYPIFLNIQDCPSKSISLLPKQLFMEANKLFDELKNKHFSKLTRIELDKCYILIKKLLDYTRENLTTKQLARYVLKYIYIMKI